VVTLVVVPYSIGALKGLLSARASVLRTMVKLKQIPPAQRACSKSVVTHYGLRTPEGLLRGSEAQ